MRMVNLMRENGGITKKMVEEKRCIKMDHRLRVNSSRILKMERGYSIIGEGIDLKAVG